jgi:hypothetical protein
LIFPGSLFPAPHRNAYRRLAELQASGQTGPAHPQLGRCSITEQIPRFDHLTSATLLPGKFHRDVHHLRHTPGNPLKVKPLGLQSVAALQVLIGFFQNRLDKFAVSQDALIGFDPQRFVF